MKTILDLLNKNKKEKLREYLLNNKINITDLSKYDSVFIIPDNLIEFLLNNEDVILSFNKKEDAFKYCVYLYKASREYLITTLVNNDIKDKDTFIKAYSKTKAIESDIYIFINKVKDYYKIDTSSKEFLNINKVIGNYFVYKDKGIQYIDVKTSPEYLILIYQLITGKEVKTEFDYVNLIKPEVYEEINNIKDNKFKERISKIKFICDDDKVNDFFINTIFKDSYSTDKFRVLTINVMINNKDKLNKPSNDDVGLFRMFKEFING